MEKRLFTFLAMLFVIVGLASAQRTAKGRVVSAEDNEPVIGASILVKGTTVGTVTDFDGNFELGGVPSSAKSVVVSYVGMLTQEVAIKPVMQIVMQSDSKQIDEVVVVAYGTASARSLTASISSVKGDALKDVPGSSVDGMLQGRAAGVMISTPGSAVGQAPVINIRGVASINSSTTPLYVVDGMPINTDNLSSTTDFNALADINPADIKSIDILKDAAATAMYGSRAAAGVVLITTKSGGNSRAKVTYDYALGVNDPTKMIKVLNAEQYVEIKNLGCDNSGRSHMYALMTDSNGKTVDTNWSDLLFRTGISQNHNLNITGGNDRAQYYLGAGYTTQDGITVGDEYNRFSFKGNATIKANDYLKLGFNTSYSNSRVQAIDSARRGSIYSINGFSRMALILPPNVAAYNEDGTANLRGKYLGSGANSFNISYYNPMSYIDGGQYDESDNNRVLASGFAELTPFKGLTLRSQYGVDWTFMESSTFRTPLGGDGYDSHGSSTNYRSNRKIWTWTNTADYKLSLKEHHFDVLLGTEATETTLHTIYRSGTGLSDEDMQYVEAGYLSYSGSGSRFESAMFSYISRFTYDWNNRYYLTANLRRDGLSKLGRQWGNFWGVSGAWRVSDEAFFTPLKDVVSDMKLKASYGVVGNANVGGVGGSVSLVDTSQSIKWYASQSLYGTNYYNGAAAIYSTSINDANLGWEQTGTYDFGLAAALWGGKVNVDVDYFYSKSKDLILSAPQAYSTGIVESSISTNLGKAENKGLELSINAALIEKKDFSWNSTFNVSFVKNKILELAENIVENGTGANNITTEGLSMSQLYVYPTAGIDSQTGRRIVVLNDGTKGLLVYNYQTGARVYSMDMSQQLDINNWQPEIFGNTKPTWYGGWTNNFRYKGFDATVFFQFSGGNKIYNGTKATASDGRFWNTSLDYYQHAWRQAGDNATYAKVEYNDNYSNGSANPISDWVEKGDYLRLKNVSLGYTFNTKKWPKSLGITSLRLYAQVQNLFCITGYSGMDPEVSSRADSANLISGIDKNTTPLTKTYTFGLNVSF